MYTYLETINFRPEEVLVYLRKSRTDDPTLTVEEVLAKHETILDEWSEKNLGGKVPETNKFREVVSGETIADRPEMQRILKLIESPRIKAVLTVEVQRISRGDLEDAGHIIKLLRYTNTIVITPQKIYDITNEYDREFFERELKRGNEFLEYQKKIMKRGTLLSVSQGNYVGNAAPYGWDKAWVMEGKRRCPTLRPNEEQAKVVCMAYELFCNKDMSVYGICDHFDKIGIRAPKGEHWSPSSLREILGNPVHMGKIRWNRRKTVTVVENGELTKTRPRSKNGECLIYDGKHQPIISEEMFNIAQEKLKQNSGRTKRSNKIRNPLASLIYCQCGTAMTLRTHTLPDGSQRYSPRLVCNNMKHCHTGSCTYEELLKLVRNDIQREINDFEIMTKNEPSNAVGIQEKAIKNLEKKLSELEAREIAQWEAQTDPDPNQRMPAEIFTKLNEKLRKEKAETIEALRNARNTIPSIERRRQALIRFRKALRVLDNKNATAEEKNRLLKNCIIKIRYEREAPKRIGKSDGQTENIRGAHWTNPPINIEITFNI